MFSLEPGLLEQDFLYENHISWGSVLFKCSQPNAPISRVSISTNQQLQLLGKQGASTIQGYDQIIYLISNISEKSSQTFLFLVYYSETNANDFWSLIRWIIQSQITYVCQIEYLLFIFIGSNPYVLPNVAFSKMIYLCCAIKFWPWLADT